MNFNVLTSDMLSTYPGIMLAITGLTQAELAKSANVSRKTINTIENKAFIPLNTLTLTLAKVLDVNVHALFELSDTDSH